MAAEISRAWSWDWRVELLEDGLPKTQAGHFKLEGRRVDYVRAGPKYSRRGRGLAGGGALPRLGCLQAGSRSRLSRGADAGRLRRAGPRQTFQVWLGQRGGAGAWLRECRSAGAGAGGASEGDGSRTHFLGWKCCGAGPPCPQEEVRDRSRTHFLRLD